MQLPNNIHLGVGFEIEPQSIWDLAFCPIHLYLNFENQAGKIKFNELDF